VLTSSSTTDIQITTANKNKTLSKTQSNEVKNQARVDTPDIVHAEEFLDILCQKV
jgi:hypothetical protein